MKERVISAIVMVLITVPFILLGNIFFSLFALVIGEMALYEFLQFRKKEPITIKVISYILIAIIILKDLIGINLESILIISIFFLLGSLVTINNKNKYHYKEALYLIGLILFLGISFSKIIFVRNSGLHNIIYLLLIAIGTDSFALFIGKKIGKTKLAPNISPKKTVEGLVGGCLVGTIIATTYYIIFIKNLSNVGMLIIITLCLSLIGEFGDLIKSTIKRYEGVKDFSNLIPGHGGIIDRVDSLIFITLLYVLIINLGGLL